MRLRLQDACGSPVHPWVRFEEADGLHRDDVVEVELYAVGNKMPQEPEFAIGQRNQLEPLLEPVKTIDGIPEGTQRLPGLHELVDFIVIEWDIVAPECVQAGTPCRLQVSAVSHHQQVVLDERT